MNLFRINFLVVIVCIVVGATYAQEKPQASTKDVNTAEGEKEAPLSGPPYRVGRDVTAPRAIYTPMPTYPEEAKKAHVRGQVELAVVIDIDGRAKNITVARSLGTSMDGAAIQAVRQWRFTPAKKNGQPVPVRVNIGVDFRN